MTMDSIRIERTGTIVTVTLDQPNRRNAISFAMWQALAQIFTDFANDATIRGVVLTGAGDCFSAGADITDFEHTRTSVEQGLAYEEAVDAACDAIASLGRPVTAAIRGYCFGGACNLAMACDFRFVAPDAQMAIPAARLSIVYGVRGTARLLALVGLAEAKRIFYTGKAFGAEHALHTGFADQIDADPAAAAAAFLDGLAALAPLSVAGAKEILTMLSMPDAPFDGQHAHCVIVRALSSEDYAEGRASFREKRQARFQGR
jgi:enoyl-CoA hydratase/carnithine racemase